MDEEIRNEETIEETEAVVEEVPVTEQPASEAEIEEEVGNIKISVEVVSTIAGIATTELPGVASMYSSFAGGIAEMFGAKKGSSKGVKVEMTDTTVAIDLYIVVDYGVRIPELAWEIQENVKNNVETMTGLEVEKVNIHIEGVNFVKEEEAIEAAETAQVLPEADE